MQFKKPGAEIFIPDGTADKEALARTTIMAISAHQDDIELMAYDGILKCFGRDDEWFTGVVVTNGAGSARNGLYGTYSDEAMQKVRKQEQKKAAFIGDYAAQLLLNYSSAEAKDPQNKDIIAELKQLMLAAKPKAIYTHNLADKHDTHVATVVKVLQAIRELPSESRPEKFYGCEVWRDLDWLSDDAKVVFDLSQHENIAMSLMGIFDSQICGGKRYDLAIAGRRRANATFSASHETDITTGMGYAMDLTPLIQDCNLNIQEYVLGYIERFKRDVNAKISKFYGK
jgi:LmbE family N-acetylglucosaminyl deacetylase